MQQEIRLFFPLISCRQLLTGVNTAYSQEIKKLRNFGMKTILPRLAITKLRKYPYEISFIFYAKEDIDMLSVVTLANYIIHLFEIKTVLQSTDYRVLPKVSIQIQHIDKLDEEGCTLSVNSLIQ